MSKKIWERYKAKTYDPKNGWDNDSAELLSLYHVAHTETALRIMNDGVCRAGLIFDESKLNKRRLLVNWLSPNIWNDGSRYGNIGFITKMEKLAASKRFYWVETMPRYKPVAIRILITDKIHDDLTQYYPETDEGPLRYDEDAELYYWNPKYTLELMLEEDIDLADFEGLRIFNHHAEMCCIDPENCKELKLDSTRAIGRFIAAVLANDLPVHKRFFRKKKNDKFKPSEVLADAGDYIMGRIYHLGTKVNGHIKSTDADAPLYMKAALNFLYRRDLKAFNSFACLFNTQQDFLDILADLIAETFQLSSSEEFSKAFDD